MHILRKTDSRGAFALSGVPEVHPDVLAKHIQLGHLVAAYPIAILLVWGESTSTAIGMVVFFLLQSFSAITSALFLPFRFVILKWQYKRHGNNLHVANLEGLAMAWAVERWRHKLGSAHT